MLQVLAHPTYRRLFGAQVVALAGTGLATVALGLLAYDLAGAGAGTVLGTVFAIKMVAYVGVAPIAAAAAVRVSPRTLLIGADLVRLVGALALPFVSAPWQVYLLVFVLQAASATFTPTYQAVIPEVLPDEDDYTEALSLSRLAHDLETVLSGMLAALLLLVVPAAGLFVGTAVGFAGSALLVASATIPRRRLPDRPSASSRLPDRPLAGDRLSAETRPFGERVSRGARLFVSTPALRPLLALNLAVAAAGAFVLVQMVVIVRDLLGRGEGAVALLLAVNGAGSMAAALLLPRLLRHHPERRLMVGGGVLLAAATALTALVLGGETGDWRLFSIGFLWLAIGAGWSTVQTPVGRIIRRSVTPADRPAVFAAQFSLSHAAWLLTYPLAGWLGAVDLAGTAALLALVAATATTLAARLWPEAPVDASTARPASRIGVR